MGFNTFHCVVNREKMSDVIVGSNSLLDGIRSPTNRMVLARFLHFRMGNKVKPQRKIWKEIYSELSDIGIGTDIRVKTEKYLIINCGHSSTIGYLKNNNNKRTSVAK